MDSIRDYILYQDHHVLVANKPAGMPVQDDLSKDPSLHKLLQAYCKRDLHLCNRIDRPVSGIVLFAKSKEDAALLNEQNAYNSMDKEYLALVEKKVIDPNGKLENRLQKSSKHKKSYVSSDETGDLARLEYRVLNEMDHYLLIQVAIKSGRFHQIRSQLAHAGIPIKGDVKYGARRSNKDRSIGLHAWKINFTHPTTHLDVAFTAPIPLNDIWPVVQTLIQSI